MSDYCASWATPDKGGSVQHNSTSLQYQCTLQFVSLYLLSCCHEELFHLQRTVQPGVVACRMCNKCRRKSDGERNVAEAEACVTSSGP